MEVLCTQWVPNKCYLFSLQSLLNIALLLPLLQLNLCQKLVTGEDNSLFASVWCVPLPHGILGPKFPEGTWQCKHHPHVSSNLGTNLCVNSDKSRHLCSSVSCQVKQKDWSRFIHYPIYTKTTVETVTLSKLHEFKGEQDFKDLKDHTYKQTGGEVKMRQAGTGQGGSEEGVARALGGKGG